MRSFADRIKCTHDVKFVEAMRALEQGKASEVQQKLAWTWIIEVVCRPAETTFVPGDPYASAFLEGRRSVAVDIVELRNTKPAKEARA